MSPDFSRSKDLQQKSHTLIPGGCHTYAKGDDQYPTEAPGFIARGEGCHVWDVDGNEYIEYGMGCRSVTLGHAYPPVLEAVRRQILLGTNFTRPSPIEVECAETLLPMIRGADMVKFTKDGSTATTAALRLARAHTGRDLVAYCADHPFFAIYDWFIGTTPMDAGIPKAEKDLTLPFRYGDIDGLRRLFGEHRNRIAAVILEPTRGPDPGSFLHDARDLCHENGAVFVLDEMITGFRWDNGGAQTLYDVVPDLSAFGKGMANGFSLSALVGKRELMERGGLGHDKERVFLLSTTHGAETHALAAAIATMKIYESEPVVATLHKQGRRLESGLGEVIRQRHLEDYIQIAGRPCNLVFAARDRQKRPSQAFRSLLLQETIRRGVIAPSLVVSYSHSDEDIDRTVEAFAGALEIYRRALKDGVEKHLVGRPSQVIYRRFNHPPTTGCDKG